MKSSASNRLLAVTAVLLSLTISASAQSNSKADSSDEGVAGTIEGLVRDIACPIQNKKATATSFNLECALECAKRGSPLIILTNDGTIYTPISTSMPDTISASASCPSSESTSKSPAGSMRDKARTPSPSKKSLN